MSRIKKPLDFYDWEEFAMKFRTKIIYLTNSNKTPNFEQGPDIDEIINHILSMVPSNKATNYSIILDDKEKSKYYDNVWCINLKVENNQDSTDIDNTVLIGSAIISPDNVWVYYFGGWAYLIK